MRLWIILLAAVATVVIVVELMSRAPVSSLIAYRYVLTKISGQPAVVLRPWSLDRMVLTHKNGTLTWLSGEAIGQVEVDQRSLEFGLLGLETAEPYAYLYYSATDCVRCNVVAEYQIEPEFKLLRELARFDLPAHGQYHNGGTLRLGPDDRLYVAIGDGGDPNLAVGRIVAIDRVTGEQEEVATGFRHPWGMAFDVTGRLWVGDVGGQVTEEINVIDLTKPTADYGWPKFEGEACFQLPGNSVECELLKQQPTAQAVLTYQHGGPGSCAIIGGQVYSGRQFMELTGWYLYSDFCLGDLFAYDESSGSNVRLAETGSQAFSVSVIAGEVYLSSDEGVFRLERTDGN